MGMTTAVCARTHNEDFWANVLCFRNYYYLSADLRELGIIHGKLDKDQAKIIYRYLGAHFFEIAKRERGYWGMGWWRSIFVQLKRRQCMRYLIQHWDEFEEVEYYDDYTSP